MNNQQLLVVTAAQKGLFYEVALSPKPGLVDRLTNGAHNDMDFYLFIDSILALTPYFSQYLNAGLTHKTAPATLFPILRELGQQAENAMFAATKGVNTHKGANFSFAVLLGATGLHLQKNQLPLTAADSKNILTLSQAITQDLLKNDFKNVAAKKNLTHGEKLYLAKGATGIRGQAAAGYPALGKVLLPYLRQNRDLPRDELLLRALVFLMSELEDSNILHRGGQEALLTLKSEMQQLHTANLDTCELTKQLRQYDKILTSRNWSPGGAADLLSLGIYFALLENLF
ncbi:putative 2-(5''-triphosphoribosyl)-3'-dephosphocoenzyme-A synthase [Enterococcus saigonensis]|uniref:Probable 2-(5''-triphosphoribosyl)-3'-dephosphocoenzyme-A synthase n=1 Tax=Enterococcus saigonensis TaxID=1805431 RepID=A0A679IRJ0_9ENTE|nr:triphosphoribosyl-dephospho-CoA synthase CitG [Enterococcus saigonensis]BCA86734.1 putative 2-(5''-triphosphoribosyl)-3'-dephosphocoenzyme-A synthase [Enterococcus saigonensis]